MSKQIHLWLGVVAAITLVATLATGCSVPQTSSISAPAAAPASAGGGAPQEGITVHGHWIIEVTNPDGTLAERREFDNALQTTGMQTLGKVLGRRNSVGFWRIRLVSTGTSPFLDALGMDAPCYIIESADSVPLGGVGSVVYETLTLTVPTSGANLDKLVLSGTATAGRAGSINSVLTIVVRMDATQPPSSPGAGGTLFTFTSTTLASPVSLANDQQVAVTVIISFS